jgi:hypothetical protein
VLEEREGNLSVAGEVCHNANNMRTQSGLPVELLVLRPERSQWLVLFLWDPTVVMGIPSAQFVQASVPNKIIAEQELTIDAAKPIVTTPVRYR